MAEFDYESWLFGEGDERPAPHAKGSETSRLAAESLTTRCDDARRILELYATGNYTRDEVVVALGESRYSTLTARVTDLCDAGCLVPTGERRKTRRGRFADVLMLAPGATLEWFTDWLRGARPSAPSQKAWLKDLGRVALEWAKDPTPENEATLKRVLMAGRALVGNGDIP